MFCLGSNLLQYTEQIKPYLKLKKYNMLGNLKKLSGAPCLRTAQGALALIVPRAVVWNYCYRGIKCVQYYTSI